MNKFTAEAQRTAEIRREEFEIRAPPDCGMFTNCYVNVKEVQQSLEKPQLYNKNSEWLALGRSIRFRRSIPATITSNLTEP